MSTWNVGKGISDLLVDELLSTGDIRLIERAKIDDVLREQEIASSGRVENSDAARKVGQVLAVRYLLLGSVTKFGGEERNRGGALVGIFRKMFLGGFGLKEAKGTVTLTCRIVDSSTGEILGSERGEGESKRTGILLGGLGGSDDGLAGGGINMSSVAFQETILGEATMNAVSAVAVKIASRLKSVYDTSDRVR
jgi:curli biogenesis system outer membrane secretion channel CsgG